MGLDLRRPRRLLAASLLVVGMGGLWIGATPGAQASGCPDPDYPCDPPPHPMPGPVTKPTVTFGCGTVTVTEGKISKTFQVLPCPGPVIF